MRGPNRDASAGGPRTVRCQCRWTTNSPIGLISSPIGLIVVQLDRQWSKTPRWTKWTLRGPIRPTVVLLNHARSKPRCQCRWTSDSPFGLIVVQMDYDQSIWTAISPRPPGGPGTVPLDHSRSNWTNRGPIEPHAVQTAMPVPVD